MAAGKRIPIGILYEGISISTFADRFRKAVWEKPLTELEPAPMEKIEEILSEFRARNERMPREFNRAFFLNIILEL
jgi:hypothetical protein